MAFLHGKSATVLLADANLSAYLNEMSISRSTETGETTTFGDDSKTYIVGLRDAAVSLSGLFDGGSGAIDEKVSTALGSDATEPSTLSMTAASVGAVAYLMESHTAQSEVSAPVGDVVSMSVELNAEGGTDRGVLLTDGSAVSSTSSAASFDGTSSSANGAVAHLHVTANDRDGAITVKVQHSADNLSWADLVTFTSVSSSTTTSQRSAVTGTVNRYLRADYTVAGSSGSATIYVAIARR